MVTLEEFLNGIQFRITDGSCYGWQCYGPAAHRIESYVDDEYSAEVIFDRNTQTVYEAAVCDYRTNRCYRLFNPDHKASHDEEAKEKGVDPIFAWDEVKWIDLETEEDFLEKLTAIVNGTDYDDRVIIPLDLTEEEQYRLMKMAHERDMTFNDFVADVVMKYINDKFPEFLKNSR